jgi:hypothetical protein
MKLQIRTEILKFNQIPKSYINIMIKARIKEYGKNTKNFEEDEKRAIFFFVKNNQEIVSFGMLEPIKINYLKKSYTIWGIGNIISIKKGKGYGTILIKEMIRYLKKTKRTGLGFCGHRTTKFYEKAGLKIIRLFGKRFALKNPRTGELRFEAPDDIGDGLYYEGRDKLISKMLKTKSIGTYWLPNLKNPHW